MRYCVKHRAGVAQMAREIERWNAGSSPAIGIIIYKEQYQCQRNQRDRVHIKAVLLSRTECIVMSISHCIRNTHAQHQHADITASGDERVNAISRLIHCA